MPPGVCCVMTRPRWGLFGASDGRVHALGTYRRDLVGSLLRLAYLVEGRPQRKPGAPAPAERERLADRAVDEAIALQEAAGLDVPLVRLNHGGQPHLARGTTPPAPGCGGGGGGGAPDRLAC